MICFPWMKTEQSQIFSEIFGCWMFFKENNNWLHETITVTSLSFLIIQWLYQKNWVFPDNIVLHLRTTAHFIATHWNTILIPTVQYHNSVWQFTSRQLPICPCLFSFFFFLLKSDRDIVSQLCTSYLFISAIISTSISLSLNISIQMCLLYGNISKFSYPGVTLPAEAGLMFKMYTQKMLATVKLLQN